MRKLTLVILSIWFISQTLFCETDKKEVLMKQARRYTTQRNYDKANDIYQQLMREYPDDFVIVENLIQNYITATRFKDAEELLEYNGESMPADNYYILKLRIMLAQNKTRAAAKSADQYLEGNRGRLQVYRNVSRVFEGYRQYDKSVEILLQARSQAKDEKLFSRELALNYEYLKDYSNSVIELLSYLENNKGYFYFVKSRIKNMLKDDPELINKISSIAKNSEDEKVREIYGFSLAEVQDYAAALEVYKELPSASLRSFAMSMQKIRQYEIALLALQSYINDSREDNLKADVKIEIAKIFMDQGDLENAKTILLEIHNNEKLQSRKLRYKTKANKLCRQYLAKIAMLQREDDKIVLGYLKDALAKSYSQRDKDEIKFEIIDFQINSEKFEAAKSGVVEIHTIEDPSSNSYKTANYYKFMLALMQSEAEADTLLSELLVTLPESELTNNALQLAVIAGGFEDGAKSALFSGFRKFNLLQLEDAVNVLIDFNENKPNEELYYLAGEWAILAGNKTLAEAIFAHEFTSEVLGEYAKLRQVELMDAGDEKDSLVRSFLTDHHQSIFAPAFRILMEY